MPTRQPPATVWAVFVRAGRPTGVWVCVLALFVNGVVLPLAGLWKTGLQTLDLAGLAAVVTALGLLSAARSKDKAAGVAT